MNLRDAHRVLSGFDVKYDILDRSVEEVLLLLTPQEQKLFVNACCAFANTPPSTLEAIQRKCLEIAEMNPDGGNLDDLFDAALELGEMYSSNS